MSEICLVNSYRTMTLNAANISILHVIASNTRRE
jgi:hypothetical protein